jgi:hypothetical protein
LQEQADWSGLPFPWESAPQNRSLRGPESPGEVLIFQVTVNPAMWPPSQSRNSLSFD